MAGADHIGYSIKKKFRGRNCGTKGLALTLDPARKIVPVGEIYLRVLITNMPSFKVFMHNGAYIAGEDDDHYVPRVKKQVEDGLCNSQFTRTAEYARTDFWTTAAGNGMMDSHQRRVAIT